MEAVVEEAGGGYPDGSLIGGDWKQEDLGVAERNFAGLSAIGAGGGAKGKQYGALFFLAALVAVLSGGFGFPVEQRGVGAGGAGETRAGDFGNVGAGFAADGVIDAAEPVSPGADVNRIDRTVVEGFREVLAIFGRRVGGLTHGGYAL